MGMVISMSLSEGGMQEVLEAIKASEFRFARQSSEVPFLPMGWLQNSYYPDASFEPDRGDLPSGDVRENTLSLGAIIPVTVRSRDMFLLGGDIGLDSISVKTAPFRDQTVFRGTPIAAWLHQFDEDNLMGIFAAPIFSKEIENGGSWGASGYGGVIAMHWFSDSFQLMYGGVYQNSFGKETLLPYLGLLWNPNPRWSVAAVFPWPSLTFAPNKDWILQLALSPGGSSWVQRKGEYEVTESIGSWNLVTGVGYRLHEHIWLMASAGVAGFRVWELGEEDSGLRYEAEPSAVFTLSLQFRP